MSALGRLVASIILDSSQFEGGVDRAKFAAAQGATVIDRAMKDLERSVDGTMKNIAVALAAGFGINALKNQFEAFVAFRAELDKISVTTGASVQSLSILGQAAKLAGTDIGTVEAALIKMTKGLSASNADTKDTARALEYLGISGRDALGRLKDPGDVMLEISKKLATMEDGANKTAIALALWGKAGAQMLPTMRELAETGDLIAKVTADQARAAHDLEVAWTRLQVASSASGKTVMDEFVQPLTALVTVLTDSITGADGLNASLKRLKAEGELSSWVGSLVGGIINVTQVFLILGANIKFVFETIGKDIARAIENVQLIAKGDFAGSKRLGQLFQEDAAMARAALDDTERRIMQLGKTYQDTLAQIRTPPRESLRALEWRMDNPNSFRGTDTGGGRTTTPGQINELDQALAASEIKLSGYRENFGKLMAIITQGFVTGRVSAIDYGVAVAGLISQQPAFIEGMKGQADWMARVAELRNAALAAQVDAINVGNDVLNWLEDEDKKMQAEIATLGMSSAAREKYNLRLKMELDLKRALADPSLSEEDATKLEARIKAGYEAIAQGVDLKASLQDQVKLWDSISQRAGQFFGDLVMNGKSAFDRLRSELKNFVQELLAIFAQKWILQMVAGVTGSAALGNAAASVGGNTVAGALANGLGAATGFTGLAEGISMGFRSGVAAQGAIGEQVGVWLANYGWVAGVAAAILATGFTANALFSSGWRAEGLPSANPLAPTGLTSLPGLTGVPEVGLADRLLRSIGFSDRLAAILSGSSVMDRLFGHGATHADASGISGSVTGSTFAGSAWQDYSQRGGLFSSDHRWTDTAAMTAGQSAPFTAAMSAIHEQMHALGALIGVDASELLKNYAKTFNIQLSDLSPEDAKKAIENFFHTVYVEQAALVLGGATGYIKTYIDQFKGTTDELVTAVGALVSIFDIASRNPLTDLAAAMDAQANPLQAAMRANATAVSTVMRAYDGTLTSTQNLATATRDYYNAQMQLIVGIQQARQAIGDMFGSTFRNIQIAGLDGNQAKYDFYQREAAELQRQALASNDPATIQRLAGLINQDINAAFALLTPEQQRAQSGQFLAQGRDTQSAIDRRLETIQQSVVTTTQTTLNQIRDLIGAGNTAITGAAATIQQGGSNILLAARTPLQVVFTMPNGNQVTAIR